MVEGDGYSRVHKPDSYRAINDYVTNILTWRRPVMFRKRKQQNLDPSSELNSGQSSRALTPSLTPRTKLRNQAKQISDRRGFQVEVKKFY